MKTVIVKLLKTVSTLLVVAMMILALLLAGPRALGMDVFIVLSGSMEPTYQTGSVIYVKEVDPMTLQEGDPVTFRVAEDTIVTHRIIEVIPDEENANNKYFRTKGDANDVEDGSIISCEYVVGKPVFTVPQLGFLAAYIQEPPGTYIALSAAAGMMLLVLLIDTFTEDKEAAARKQAQKAAKKAAKKQGKKRKEEDDDTVVNETTTNENTTSENAVNETETMETVTEEEK